MILGQLGGYSAISPPVRVKVPPEEGGQRIVCLPMSKAAALDDSSSSVAGFCCRFLQQMLFRSKQSRVSERSHTFPSFPVASLRRGLFITRTRFVFQPLLPFNFLWLTCSHSLCLCVCVKQPEPTLFHGSSSPEQDIFVLCVGECCADVRQIGGCRRRVRIKEDVAASSKPHETVQLPAYLSL